MVQQNFEHAFKVSPIYIAPKISSKIENKRAIHGVAYLIASTRTKYELTEVHTSICNQSAISCSISLELRLCEGHVLYDYVWKDMLERITPQCFEAIMECRLAKDITNIDS